MADNIKNNEYTVYCHESPSGKRYVGITCQDVKKRWRNGKGYANNHHFTNAINKYSWDKFEHYILFENLTKEEAEKKEIELIKIWNTTNPEHGYNISNGGDGVGRVSESTRTKLSAYFKEYYKTHTPPNLGKPMSEEARRKLSNAHTGLTWNDERKQKFSKMKKELHYHHSEETKKKLSQSHRARDNERSKRVRQYDLEGNLIQIYPSIREVERQTGFKHCNISSCCNGRIKTSNGYVWAFVSDDIEAVS